MDYVSTHPLPRVRHVDHAVHHPLWLDSGGPSEEDSSCPQLLHECGTLGWGISRSLLGYFTVFLRLWTLLVSLLVWVTEGFILSRSH